MYALCQDLPGVTEDLAGQIEAELGTGLPEGCIAHVAGPYDGGWRIVDVWQDEAALERFRTNHLRPAVQKVTGRSAPPAGSETRAVASVFARA
jgi:quinol monooxygenase YgiN